jgi:hypothetical protein
MANVTVIKQLDDLVQYLGDGAQSIVWALKQTLPPRVKLGDGLTLYVADAVHTKVEISDTGGMVPYALIAKSNGTACTVKLYLEDSDDVTVGTTDAVLSVGVSATSGDLSAALFFGAGPYTLATASGIDGLTIAAPATDVGTGAVANDPTVWVVYA